jgi:hypothetical protein
MEAIAKSSWAKPHMKNHFSKHWNEYMARFDSKGRVKFATDYGVLMDAKKTETA